ncbi:hypothetical protein HYT02_04530 [Candidatus Gottesmanbacteria bacterium]|nr:hypothetical protein [Candidatus Gottesmanbacteria bacterium]
MSPDKRSLSHLDQSFNQRESRRKFLSRVGRTAHAVGAITLTTGLVDIAKIVEGINKEVDNTIPSLSSEDVEKASETVTIFRLEADNVARNGDISTLHEKFDSKQLQQAYQVFDQDLATDIARAKLHERLSNQRFNPFSKDLNAGQRNFLLVGVGMFLLFEGSNLVNVIFSHKNHQVNSKGVGH